MIQQRNMQGIDRLNFGAMWQPGQFNGEMAFGDMERAFEEALAAYPSELHESFYTFAGKDVRLRIIGRELAKHIGRPFSHLRTEAQTRTSWHLSIDIWDENRISRDAQSSLAPEDLPWTETTVQSSDKRFIGQRLPHTFSCLDRQANHIVASIAWHDRIFIYERAKPLARLLLTWLNDQNIQVIHTGLVARNENGILFAGKSGSGKSTSSLACIFAGFDFLSEDYVGLQEASNGSFIGHSLYNSVFLDSGHLARFEELIPHAIRGRLPQEEKSVIILSQVFPEQLRRFVPIRILALPRVIKSSNSKIRPASKGEALLSLGPSSLLQIPNKDLGARGLDKLVRLVERVPCYSVEVGGNLRSIARSLDRLLLEVDP